MRFNKYLAMCFLASTLMCGSFTSCSDDDDNDAKKEVENGKSAREEGKEFGENYKTIMNGDAAGKTTAAISMITAASKYKNADKTYRVAFAEGAAETGILGDSTKGDDAVNKLDAVIEGYESAMGVVNGSNEDKANALLQILNALGGNGSSSSAE